jgi:uncharacterized membrane protein YhaH (DUF805 family)
MFKNPFSFQGRIRRLEYGLSTIIYYVVFLLLNVMLPKTEAGTVAPTSALILLAALIPLGWFVLAQGAKRCHDKGQSGWYQLIPFYSLLLIFSDGNYGVNEYGPNPKGLGNDTEIDEIGKEISY